jgi:hypothetical protein
MPCLNEARTVGTCVRKALDYLDQHHVKGEVIVAHNGSTDGSQAGQALVAAGLSAGRTGPRWGGERGTTTGRRAAMGVRPLHSIGEVAEGNEAMEKRGRQEGITMEQAKGQTQRWQPLLPNLWRVNEAAIAPPPVLPEEPAAVTPHGGFRGDKSQQWLCATR